GMLLGMFSFASIPVDHARADLWVGSPEITSVDMGRPIRASHIASLLIQPDVIQAETCVAGFAYWQKPVGGMDLGVLIGSGLGDDGLGFPSELSAELRDRLTEPGTVVIDDADLDRLGVTGVGDFAQISQKRVRIVGLVHGMRGIAGAYVYCSMETARPA